MLCVPLNFLNFGATIYYTTKIKSNLIFLIFCDKWVIKWENHRIKIKKTIKKYRHWLIIIIIIIQIK